MCRAKEVKEYTGAIIRGLMYMEEGTRIRIEVSEEMIDMYQSVGMCRSKPQVYWERHSMQWAGWLI